MRVHTRMKKSCYALAKTRRVGESWRETGVNEEDVLYKERLPTHVTTVITMTRSLNSKKRGNSQESWWPRMEFCPNCNARLRVQDEKAMKRLLVCRVCGHQGWKPTPVKVLLKKRPSLESILVIGRETQKLKTLPTVRVSCPKCENRFAYAWLAQTRELDHPTTQFFRCTRCHYTFREYSWVGTGDVMTSNKFKSDSYASLISS
jgi:DNA-directed RNA polymerase subunit M